MQLAYYLLVPILPVLSIGFALTVARVSFLNALLYSAGATGVAAVVMYWLSARIASKVRRGEQCDVLAPVFPFFLSILLTLGVAFQFMCAVSYLSYHRLEYSW